MFQLLPVFLGLFDSTVQKLMNGFRDIFYELAYSNLSNMLSDLNEKVATISTELSTAPDAWQGGTIWELIVKIAEQVALPVAGTVFTFVVLWELISMLVQPNNLADIDFVSVLMKWLIKTIVAAWFISNALTICNCFFGIGASMVSKTTTVLNQQVTDNTQGSVLLKYLSDNYGDQDEDAESGDVSGLISLTVSTWFIDVIIKFMGILITIILYSRMISIYLHCAVAPLPMAKEDVQMAIEDKKDRDIVLLTGLPVSDEMQDVLDKCSAGEYVDIDEVNATPEMKAAESCVSNSTPTINLKDREPIQNHVFETLMNYGSISLDESGKPLVDSHGNTIYNNDVERGRRLDIVIGLPASGKSSAIVDTISYEHHSMLIDNDEAKRQFPEFNKGWGANTVHKESQIVEQAVFKQALSEGRNIVLPKVGSDAGKLVKSYISYAKDAGYKINVHFVDLDRNKALGRMMGRFIHTGRYLSPKLIDKYANERDGNRIAQAYEELKMMDVIDGWIYVWLHICACKGCYRQFDIFCSDAWCI